MANLSAQALRMAVVNAATSEAAFRNELVKEGVKAVTDRFGAQALKVRVQVEDEKELAILIPEKNERLARSLEHIAKEVGDRSPTRGEFEALVIHRAWTDPGFLTHLRNDARGAINAALKKYESSVPAEATVKLYEEQPGECLIVIPRPVEARAELSDAELEAVAGGEGVGIAGLVAGAIVGAIAGKVVDVIWAEAEA
jgi:hypothetical protein